MGRVLHDRVHAVELQPGNFQLTLLRVELLAQGPQFAEELGAGRRRALRIRRRATRPPAHSTDEQSGQHDHSAT